MTERDPITGLPDVYRREAARLRGEADKAETAEMRGALLEDAERTERLATEIEKIADREAEAAPIAQAKALKEQASKCGLRFEAYLPPDLAEWLLNLIERGVFADPSEAVFVIMGEHRDMEPHADLRRELLSRSLQSAIDDPRPSLSDDDVKKLLDAPMAEAAVWRKPEG